MWKNNPNCMTGVPWYNTYICKKIHWTVFEEFIKNARTDRYNLIFPIYAHEKEHPSTVDDGSSGGGYVLPSNSKTGAYL